MANQEQLQILNQGVDAWNEWRKENNDTEIDLRVAKLSRAILTNANLKKANLTEADLNRADLTGADLSYTDLGGANLNGADLSYTDLSEARLGDAKLNRAILISANLKKANFRKADLSEAVLSGARLVLANLDETKFGGADLSGALLEATRFSNIDLSNSKGLEFINHQGASTLGTDTLQLSMGKLPDVFLRGCGLSDWEIESAKLYNPNITNQEMTDNLYRVHEIRAKQPIQISKPFISYSHGDSDFVSRLERSLNEKGVRFWRDIYDSTSGPLEKQIDRAISQNPIVLVVLSENSIESDWVQHEVRKARELEKEIGRHVLCPVRLDNSFFSSSWPERIKEQVLEYNILDFSKWKDDKTFENMFVRLLDGLNLYYKKDEHK